MKSLLYFTLGFILMSAIVLFSSWTDQDSKNISNLKAKFQPDYQAYEETLK